jgi:F0F1-type ATP synthase assembly protein I
MAIPAGLGLWGDSVWKTAPWFTIAGIVLGFVVAMFELVKLAKDSDRVDSSSRVQRPDTKQEREQR